LALAAKLTRSLNLLRDAGQVHLLASVWRANLLTCFFAHLLEQFSNRCSPFETVQGGFYFHPNEQSPLVGDPGEEKATRPHGFGVQQLENCYNRLTCSASLKRVFIHGFLARTGFE
jgi:hypothetical protein